MEKADERIENHRTGHATLELYLPNGEALERSTQVHIEQTRHEFLFGCNLYRLDRLSSVRENEAYKKRFSELFNFATLPFYWWSYEYTQGQPSHMRTEELLQWCASNGIAAKGHPMAWNWMDPAWLPEDPESVLDLQFARIEWCAQRFKDKIGIWDVVNEATHFDRESTLEQAPKLTRAIQEMERGPYIRKAFETARQANPNAKLIINDYKVGKDYEVKVLEELVDENDMPLYDIIGLQSHMHRRYWGARHTWRVCERFTDYDIPLHFTEVTLLSGAPESNTEEGAWPSTRKGEKRQAREIAEFYTVLFSHPSVEAITWWDLSDQGAWQNAPAGLLRHNQSRKPAYKALYKLVKKQWWTDTTARVDSQSRIETHGFLGEHIASVRIKGKKYSVPFTIDKDKNSLKKLTLKHPHDL